MIFYFKKLIPAPIISAYHFLLAFLGAVLYGFPSRKIFVIGVTGTKGKTTVTELLRAFLESAGHKTAVANTIQFKIGNASKRNYMKMTMPGRFFLQEFLRDAVRKKCKYAVLEMTSEGAKQFRHKWIALDALIFTNLSPEHIESHGSYEKYRDAKLAIARALAHSPKKRRVIIANADDKEGEKFLAVTATEKYSYRIADAAPYSIDTSGLHFTFDEEKFASPLEGIFNLYNILAAITLVSKLGIKKDMIKKTLAAFAGIPGRVEHIHEGQLFDAVVDYAHTPDSLEKLYKTFEKKNKICVLGATGGGRDKRKRKEFGKIAETYCKKIILTNEDPYDENPRQIVSEIQSGISNSKFLISNVIVEMDRREAIRKALILAGKDDIVLITGKGTDPYIMGPRGAKTRWDDRDIVREELKKILNR